MDYKSKTKTELISICKDKNITGYTGKKKDEIIKMITTALRKKKLRMIDLFAGTGAFTYAFENTGNV